MNTINTMNTMGSLENIRDNFLHKMQSNIRSFADLLNHIDNSISCGTAEISTVTKIDNLITGYFRSVSYNNDTSNIQFLDTSSRIEDCLSSDSSDRDSSNEESSNEKDDSDERSESSDRMPDYNNTESEDDSDSEIGLNLSHNYMYGLSNVSANNTSKYSNFSSNILNNEIDTDVFPIYKEKKDLLETFNIFMKTVNIY